MMIAAVDPTNAAVNIYSATSSGANEFGELLAPSSGPITTGNACPKSVALHRVVTMTNTSSKSSSALSAIGTRITSKEMAVFPTTDSINFCPTGQLEHGGSLQSTLFLSMTVVAGDIIARHGKAAAVAFVGAKTRPGVAQGHCPMSSLDITEFLRPKGPVIVLQSRIFVEPANKHVASVFW